jgi:general secretion pathway protein G
MHTGDSRSAAGKIADAVCLIAFVGLLAWLVMPKLRRDGNAKMTAAQVEISNLGSAIVAFHSDCGRYPTTLEGLRALMVAPAGATGWRGPYLDNGVPMDSWGNPYAYGCPGQHNGRGFDLYSFGPEGPEGGSDYIGNWTNK